MNSQSASALAAPYPPVSARYRYFPGWTMMGVAATAQYLSAPGQSYSVAAFKDPMRSTLGLSETEFSLAYAFATVLSACLLPFIGRLVDRLGARVMLALVAVGLGSGCLFMSGIGSLPELYVAFSIVRSLGQGALSLIAVWLVGEWFQRQRGIATAVAGLGGGFSVMTVPLLNNWLISRYGWEAAWSALAVAVWGVLILPSLCLVRNRPEDVGLHPDGVEPRETDLDEATQATTDWRAMNPTEQSWTVGEVLRDRTFWKVLSVPATSGLVGTGLIFHQVGVLGGHGLTATWALGMMSVQAAFATLIAFAAGWATDRIASRYLLGTAMVMLALANVLALTMPFKWLAVVYALLLGLHGSVMRSTAQVVWINYYGRTHQGAVRGLAWSAMILAAALGPIPLAVSIDSLGSYTPALCVFVVLPLAAATAVWTAHPPRRPHMPSR